MISSGHKASSSALTSTTSSTGVAVAPNETTTPRTYIGRLFLRMESCLQELGVDCDTDETTLHLENISILIHESMSISSRNYHSVQHVFDISKDLEDPIAILAALFHDCVYYNIDGGLSEVQAAKLEGALLIEESNQNNRGDGTTRIHPDAASDELLHMVVQLYNFEPNQVVTPFTGINEYLSAVIAVRELEVLLPRTVLAQIAVCIEATIPFRPPDDAGITAMDRLHDRLVSVVDEFGLDLNEEQAVQAVQRAVLLGNEDIGNFGSDDQFWFLDNTWSLLPESNEALRQKYLYTVKEFQFAVFKMNGFFSFLNPNVIFQQFRNVPCDAVVDRLTQNARRNLEIGRKYVGAKLLSISVLAAFAELTGGDAPISLFMGDLPSRHRLSRRLEDNLQQPPEDETCVKAHCDQIVYEILAHGRRRESSFDVKKSPLAAYFYAFMGDEGVEKLLREVKVHPMNQKTARLLLSRLPPEAVQHVATNMKGLATSRVDLISHVVESLAEA